VPSDGWMMKAEAVTRGATHTMVQILLSSRPVSWINTAFPFAAAYVLTAGEVDALLIVGTLFFLIPYNLLMYGVNDVFDYESDLQNPRKGGSEGALLEPELHRAVVWAGIATATPLLVALLRLGGTGNPWSWAVLAVSLFAVFAYSVPGLRFKERPVLDSIISSTHFVSPAVYGLAVAGAEPTPQLIALLVAFFCWGMASHAFGAVQDVMPDREGGIASIATALGARATVRAALGLWVVAGLLMLATEWPGPPAALLIVPYLVAAWPYRSLSDADSGFANRGWRRFIVLNYVVGFLATLLLIWWALLRS
jgi:4-hydroxybenzoate polyprenyltransferase